MSAQPDERERLLARLESVLQRQLALAANEDYAGLDALTGEVGELLALADSLPGPPSPKAIEGIRRIRDLRGRLLLDLAARRQEIAGKLGAMTAGKRTLRAYRDGTC